MSYQYDLYLQKHKANVKKGFDWLQTNMPWLFEGKPDAAWQTEFEHDASKSKPDEYEAYDAYFYGGNRSYAVVQAFQRAWHGAGRLMSRRAALNTLSMDEFQKEMVGIYSTCVVPDTLDESPMAYKSMDEIVSQIRPTAEIVERIRPVYNFKASD